MTSIHKACVTSIETFVNTIKVFAKSRNRIQKWIVIKLKWQTSLKQQIGTIDKNIARATKAKQRTKGKAREWMFELIIIFMKVKFRSIPGRLDNRHKQIILYTSASPQTHNKRVAMWRESSLFFFLFSISQCMEMFSCPFMLCTDFVFSLIESTSSRGDVYVHIK